MNRKETYGKYVFRQTKNGKLTIYARVGYKDENGRLKYLYKRAASENEAAQFAEQMLKDLRTESIKNNAVEISEKLDGALCDLFFAVKGNQTDFRQFKRKILKLFFA